ncbi:MAG TPA: molybdenum cofactor guanylyltransferase [Bacteroidales bacterium]|nr:molybdenum cofactor guanylyltransferase [Bacteroidales bacterium]
MDVTGIILAGGKSSRMGEDKGLLVLGEKTLAEIAIGHLSGICSELVISTNNPDYRQFGLQLIADQYKGIGPLGGLHTALSVTKTALNLVLSVDLPFVNAGALEYLLSLMHGHQAAVPLSAPGCFEPLCASYHVSVLPQIESAIQQGDFKMQHLLEKVKTRYIQFSESHPFRHPDMFFNINSPGDLKKAQKLSASNQSAR